MAGQAINPLSIVDPQSVADQSQIEWQRQMAAALMQGGMQQPQGGMAGQVYVGPSWTQGLANMLKVYGGKQMMDTANKQSVGLAQRQGQMLRSAFGMGAPDQPQQPDPVQQGLAQGAANGSVGPTNANAAAVNALRTQPQPAPAPQAGPMTMPGMSPGEAMARYLMAPEEYSKAMMSNFTPTDLQKNARAGGLGPDAIGNVVKKEGYIPPNKVSQGEVALDPMTGKPIISVPKTADGINLNFANQLAPTASAVPGYAPASAGIKGAETHAVEANKVYTNVPGPDGSLQSGFLFGGGGGSAPPAQAPQVAQPATNGAPQPPMTAPRQMGRGGAIVGPSTTDAAIQKSGADVIGSAPQIVASSRSAVRGLENALQLAEAGTPSGTGVSKSVNAMSLLNNMHIPLMAGDVNGYQTLQKYLQNSLNQAAQGTGSSGSDARFESFMHGQPNAETMNPTALKSAIRYVLSQHDAAVTRGNFLTQAYQQAKANGDPNAAQTAQAQWAQIYNPRYFEIQRLSPQEQVKAVDQMSPQQAAQFMAWRKQVGGLQ